MKNDREKKKFKLFDMNRDGKGVYTEENRKPTFLFFFKLFGRKFTQLIRLNLFFLVQMLPVLAFIYVYFAGYKTPTATEIIYSPLYGISKIAQSADITALLDIQSAQMSIPVLPPVIVIVLLCLGIFMAVTFGWFNVGTTYVLRGLFRGDPVFIFSDFFYAVKRNFKQAFWVGLMDFVFIAVLVVDFIYFYSRTGSYFNDVMYFMIFAIAIIYLVMRFYIYHLLITFDLSTLKILKNSLIFAVLGIKRNFLAILGIVLLLALNIIFIIMFISIGITIPMILPFFYIMATLGFMITYAAYPVIDKYMIAPYNSKKEIAEPEEEI